MCLHFLWALNRYSKGAFQEMIQGENFPFFTFDLRQPRLTTSNLGMSDVWGWEGMLTVTVCSSYVGENQVFSIQYSL